MSKSNKQHYTCRNCRQTFLLENVPECCPNCSCTDSIYKGTLKSYKYAEHCIATTKVVLPEMEKVMRQFEELYLGYIRRDELLRGYARRGIIKYEDIPKFNHPNFWKSFHTSRKRKK